MRNGRTGIKAIRILAIPGESDLDFGGDCVVVDGFSAAFFFFFPLVSGVAGAVEVGAGVASGYTLGKKGPIAQTDMHAVPHWRNYSCKCEAVDLKQPDSRFEP